MLEFPLFLFISVTTPRRRTWISFPGTVADKLLVADFSDLARRELIIRLCDALAAQGRPLANGIPVRPQYAIMQTLRDSLGNGVAPLPSLLCKRRTNFEP